METAKIDDHDFNVWYNSVDPKFLDICVKSKIPGKWISYSNAGYENSVLKPINRYVKELYPRPQLVSIEDSVVTLRQTNHAEIFLLESSEGFRNIDRPHMRQYYQSSRVFPADANCFDPVYAFYTPWILDANISVNIMPSADSPFQVYETTQHFKDFPEVVSFIEPEFVPFRFKRVGEHMVNKHFGKIKINSPMFDLVFKADDILIKKIKEFYEQD